MKKIAVFLTIVIAFYIITGCGPIKPKFVPLGTHDLTFISSPNPVTLVNAQEIKEMKFGNLRTNLDEWTNQAISHINWWLENSNVPVIDNAKKVLKISMMNPQQDTASGCITVTLNIETSDGANRKYPVKGCAVGLNRAAGYAISYTILDFIHDPSVIRYISE